MTNDFSASTDDLAHLADTQSTIIDLLGRNIAFNDFLESLCALLRRQFEGSIVTILLPTPDGDALQTGLGLDHEIDSSAPQIMIEEGAATSGTAAFRREPVITTDIANDPMWASWRQHATELGLGACWSIPLIGSDDRLLGVLAVMWSKPAIPNEHQSWLHEKFAKLTATVIESYRSQSSVTLMLAEERRAMAQDLHDDPIQAITAVSLRVQRLLTSATDDQRAQLLEIQATVAGAIDRMRSMLFELHPPTLDDEGLASAVELYLYERIDPLDIQWELHDHLKAEPTTALSSLAYRLTREALSNVAHHSDAGRVDVTLEGDTRALHVLVVDNGIGCDIDAATKGRAGHLGTVSSRHLAQRASGRWSIDSQPGDGTTVEFWLPAGHPI